MQTCGRPLKYGHFKQVVPNLLEVPNFIFSSVEQNLQFLGELVL